MNGNIVMLNFFIGIDVQYFSLNGINFFIENGNMIDLSLFMDGVEDVDVDFMNELQDIFFNFVINQFSIFGGSIVILFVGGMDVDVDFINEI